MGGCHRKGETVIPLKAEYPNDAYRWQYRAETIPDTSARNQIEAARNEGQYLMKTLTDKETEDMLDAPEREEHFCVARYPYIMLNAADYDIVGGIVKALEVHGVPEHKCHTFITEALAARAADEADDAEEPASAGSAWAIDRQQAPCTNT